MISFNRFNLLNRHHDRRKNYLFLFSDLPVCRASGIGAATNEISRRDGRRADMHPLEDRSFHFSVDEFGLCVYGLFDGFGGSQVISENK